MRSLPIIVLIGLIACRTTKIQPPQTAMDATESHTSAPSSSQTNATNDESFNQQATSNTLTEVAGDGYVAIAIPAGTFTMGCTSEQGTDCQVRENPVHTVTISKDYYLMENEVTQALYARVMGQNPSNFKGANRPVEKVSWYDAVIFCNKLSELEGLEQCYTITKNSSPAYGLGDDVSWLNKSCNGWRLPTEAEWEYAARGGQSFKYAGSDNLDEVAWYDGNSARETHPVGQKKPNGYGLYDMSGNVYEWVWDWFGDYNTANTTDPTGPYSGECFGKGNCLYHMNRGGSWYDNADVTRVAFRRDAYPIVTTLFLGFRAARNP